MTNFEVIKRSGDKESYDVSKIKQCIEWACEGVNVNPLVLELSLNTSLISGVTTKTIQDTLIEKAKSLISLENPDWKEVAGRLYMQQLWKEMERFRGFRYFSTNYVKFLKYQEKQGRYDISLIWKNYTEEELQEAASLIDVQRDFLFDYAGSVMNGMRYLLPGSLPQEMFMTIALLLAATESKSKMTYVKDYYYAFSTLKISLATPILLNFRKIKGNTSSCFTLTVDDSLDSIMSNATSAAQISKNAGGVGIALSKIRAKHAPVMGYDNASGGVLNWARVYNTIANSVNQGSVRKGAFTVALDIWHNDILEFLHSQLEHGGDLRLKIFDVFPQVCVQDLFMLYAKENKKWYTVCPYDVKAVFGVKIEDLTGVEFSTFYEDILIPNIDKLDPKRVTIHNAKELLKEIIKVQLETGLPYLFFKDTVNNYNQNLHKGITYSTNLCTEYHSNTVPDELISVCNLCSLNLANLSLYTIPKYTKLSVRILDTLIDLTKVPISEGKKHNDLYRTIGVGTLGLADFLAKNELNYFNGKELIAQVYEVFAYNLLKESVQLAKERGAYPYYEGSLYQKGSYLGKSREWFTFTDEGNYAGLFGEKYDRQVPVSKWIEVFEDMEKYGVRNGELSCIAPNTSTSLMQGATASFLPTYSRFFNEKLGKGTVPRTPKYLSNKFMYYTENINYPQKELVDVVGNYIQPWITMGVSMELLFNLNLDYNNPKYIYETIMEAWEKQCKAIYYVRTKQKLLEEECTMCAG